MKAGPLLGTALKVVWNSFAVLGVVSVGLGVWAAYHLAGEYDLTPGRLAVIAAEKAGFGSSAVEKALAPAPRFEGRELSGSFREGNPRILFSGQEAVEGIRRRYKNDPVYKKQVDRWTKGAARWLCSGDQGVGEKAIESLLGQEVKSPNAMGDYGNGMSIALQYSMLSDHPGLTTEKRQRLELLLERSLEKTLAVLDGDSASLWHGRFQLACAGWVVAAVLGQGGNVSPGLVSRAQGHFLEALRALELSGGWPEGYSYWINNRAYPFALACLAHLNAVDAPVLNESIRRLMERVGLWTIYGTEPIGRFVLFGDTSPRNDLKDETQRVIDLITLGTSNPLFLDYSKYIQGLHGGAGYYSGYRWGRPVFRGPPELDFSEKEALDDLSAFKGRLPFSRVFGPEGLGQVFIRSGWGPEDTFIYFQAGHTFSHHGHYQAGHFSITKGAPLAVKSGTNGGYTSPHRLNYYLRTVAANSLLVLRPGERVRPNKFFEENVACGGQRVVMPTGSAVLSVDDWRENLHRGRHYEGGRIVHFEDVSPEYVYLKSDLTGAYNNTEYDETRGEGKVSRVERQLVYLVEDDVILVHDRVKATEGEYVKKWLLHSWSKPVSGSETVLKGTQDNGILETKDSLLRIVNQGSMLDLIRLLPEDGVVRKVGGPDYRYYVEADGDEAELDGKNMAEGAKEKPWFDAGLWRIEIQPRTGREFDQFLVAMRPALSENTPPMEAELVQAGAMTGVRTGRNLVLFGSKGLVDGPVKYVVPEGTRRHILVDLPPGKRVAVEVGNNKTTMEVSPNGTLTIDISPGDKGAVRITPEDAKAG